MPADFLTVQSFELADDLSELDMEELDEMDEDDDEEDAESHPRKKART